MLEGERGSWKGNICSLLVPTCPGGARASRGWAREAQRWGWAHPLLPKDWQPRQGQGPTWQGHGPSLGGSVPAAALRPFASLFRATEVHRGGRAGEGNAWLPPHLFFLPSAPSQAAEASTPGSGAQLKVLSRPPPKRLSTAHFSAGPCPADFSASATAVASYPVHLSTATLSSFQAILPQTAR